MHKYEVYVHSDRYRAFLIEKSLKKSINVVMLKNVEIMSEKELLSRITIDPQICHGKPCIRGLRYPVEFILEMLSGPTSVEEFLKDYSDLEEDDIRAAFAFGAGLSRSKRFESLVAA